MQPAVLSPLVFPQHIYIEKSELENLFIKAELGEWETIFDKILKNPNLVNLKLTWGPNTGKTLLWIAASQLGKNTQAFEFIRKIMNHNFLLDFEATPTMGPDQGVTVLWHLVKFVALIYDDEGLHEFENREVGEIVTFIGQHLQKYPKCNLNSAPKEGVFKDVSTFCFLSAIFNGPINQIMRSILEHAEEISASYYPFNKAHNKDVSNVLFILIHKIHAWEIQFEVKNDYLGIDFFQDQREAILENFKKLEAIQNKCLKHVIKILQKNPNCNVHFELSKPPAKSNYGSLAKVNVVCSATNALEMIISLPSSPIRDKLVVYLIFMGATLSESAHKDWKEEYVAIEQKLNTVFKKAQFVLINNLAESHQIILLSELKLKIALDMILSAIPELQDFPIQKIQAKLVFGFSHK